MTDYFSGIHALFVLNYEDINIHYIYFRTYMPKKWGYISNIEYEGYFF